MTFTGLSTSAYMGPFLHKYIFKILFCDCIYMKINMLILYLKYSLHLKVHLLGLLFNGTPLQYSCLENPMDGGAW